MKNVFINVTKQKYLPLWMISAALRFTTRCRATAQTLFTPPEVRGSEKYGAQRSAYTNGVYCFNLLFYFPLFVYFRRFRSAWSSKRRQCLQCESNGHRVHRRR